MSVQGDKLEASREQWDHVQNFTSRAHTTLPCLIVSEQMGGLTWKDKVATKGTSCAITFKFLHFPKLVLHLWKGNNTDLMGRCKEG